MKVYAHIQQYVFGLDYSKEGMSYNSGTTSACTSFIMPSTATRACSRLMGVQPISVTIANSVIRISFTFNWFYTKADSDVGYSGNFSPFVNAKSKSRGWNAQYQTQITDRLRQAWLGAFESGDDRNLPFTRVSAEKSGDLCAQL